MIILVRSFVMPTPPPDIERTDTAAPGSLHARPSGAPDRPDELDELIPPGEPDAALKDARALELSLRGIIASLQRALEDIDPALSPVQLWCLRELEVCGSATVKDLAEAIGVVPSTVSRNADRLVAEGLISRRTSAGDRRLVDLKLTRAGARVLAEVFEARAQTIYGTVIHMDSADRAALRRGAESFAAVRAARDAREGRL